MNGSNDFFNQSNSETGTFRSDTDISGMDVESAKDYVMAFITSLKQLQQQMTSQGQELVTWQERVLFARERNRSDLAAAAELKVKEIQGKIASLQAEEKELALKIKELLENFKKLKAGFSFSIDADGLLAELNMIVGEKDELAQQFKEEEALSELEKLKAKINSQETTDPSGW